MNISPDDNANYRMQSDEVLKKLAELDSQPDVIYGSGTKPVDPTKIKIKTSIWEKLGNLFRSWKFWVVFVLLLVATTASLWFWQPSRIWALNMLRLQTSFEVTAKEEGNDTLSVTELKNYRLSVDGKEHNSGDSATLHITDTSYGKKMLRLQKDGYAPALHEVMLDIDPFFGLLGKNTAVEEARKLTLKLKATGISVSFLAKDWLSGLPLTSGKFILGDKVVTPNEDGFVILTVPPTDEKIVKVTTQFAGAYIDTTIDLDIKSTFIQPQNFSFVPTGKAYFASKRSGVFSVYSSNIDGSELQEVVAGTQQETSSLAFAVSPSGKYALMVSTREGTRDDKGRLQQKLYLVDLGTKKLEPIDKANSFQFFDWSGDHLVFSATTLGEPTPSVKLRSFNVATKSLYDLGTASTQGISNTYVSRDEVIYLKSESCVLHAACDQNTVNIATVRGQNAKELAKGKVFGIRPLDFDRFAYKVGEKWYETSLNTDQTKEMSEPTVQARQYLATTSPNGKKQIIIDYIDGKNTLITKESGQEKKHFAAGGLGGPIRWLGDDVIVFRVSNSVETADYAISTKGGEPKKISDVTATATTGDSGFGYYRYY